MYCTMKTPLNILHLQDMDNCKVFTQHRLMLSIYFQSGVLLKMESRLETLAGRTLRMGRGLCLRQCKPGRHEA